MRRILTGSIAAAAAAAFMTLSHTGPATAQVAGPRIAAPFAAPATPLVTQVQWRRRGWGGRRVWRGRRAWGPRRYWRPRAYWRGPRYRYYGPGWGWWGPAAAAGFATGLLLAPRPYYAAPVYDDAIAYCIRRFRSYDIRTRTYLGYDGRRHPCP